MTCHLNPVNFVDTSSNIMCRALVSQILLFQYSTTGSCFFCLLCAAAASTVSVETQNMEDGAAVFFMNERWAQKTCNFVWSIEQQCTLLYVHCIQQLFSHQMVLDLDCTGTNKQLHFRIHYFTLWLVSKHHHCIVCQSL